MEMDDAVAVRLHNVLREKDTLRQVTGYLARHVVAHDRGDLRVLVGVFGISLLVLVSQKRQNLVVRTVRLATELMLVTIGDVVADEICLVLADESVFYQVLHFLNVRDVPDARALVLNVERDGLDFLARDSVDRCDTGVGLFQGNFDFATVERNLLAVALLELHNCSSSFYDDDFC